MPDGGRWMAGGLSGGRIYLTGGDRAGGRPGGELWIYNIEGDFWTRGPDMPRAVSGHACALLDGVLWCLGGRGEEGVVDAAQAYHIGSGRWSLGPRLPKARWQHGAAAVAGAIFLAGGNGGDGVSRGEAWRFDAGAEAWEELEPMPTFRRCFSCCALEGGVYCAGGFAAGAAGPVRAVERLDAVSGSWSVCLSLPEPRWGGGCGELGGRLYRLGGFSGVADVLDGGRWRILRGAPGLSGCCVASGEGRLFAAGGFSEREGYSGELWELAR